MKKFLSFIVLLLLIFFNLVVPVSTTNAYYSGTTMSPSVVVGQPNFTSNSTATTASGFNSPAEVFVDGAGRMIVADLSNNRVLVYNKVPTTSGASADLVLGQADFVSGSANRGGSVNSNTFSSPSSVYSDGTRLFVADNNNGRVLIWNNFPTSNGQGADVVVGQASMTVVAANCTAAGLNLPYGVRVFNNKLVVSDRNQRRLLVWNSVPTTDSASADVVIGQANFTSCGATTASQQSVTRPRGIDIDINGRLFAVDENSNRVMLWNSIPTSNNSPADVVIGQQNFTSTSAGTSANQVTATRSIFSSGNRFFYPDGSRVLIWNSTPTINGASADLVLGQASFTTNSANCGSSISASCFDGVARVFEYGNKLFTSEATNHRILIFNNIIDTPQMNINLPLEKIDDTRLRVRGNIQLGSRTSTYAMQWVKAEVNGQGLGYVTSLGGGRDNGDNLTLYDFFHEFNPITGVNTDMNNYTLKLVASSFNADTTSLFYFQPFNFNYVRRSGTSLNFSFNINKYQIQKTKDNIDHFEIQTSTDSGKFWKKYSTNITTDKIDTNTGQVYLTIPNSLLPGIKYSVKVIAISRDSNWQQPSNILNYFVPKKVVKK